MTGKKIPQSAEPTAPFRQGGHAKRKALTFACWIQMPDGRVRSVEDLTPEEKTEWQRRTLRRLSEDMSDYYTQHPAEYARL